MEYVASNSRANIIIVADEEQLDKVMQVVEILVDHIFKNIVISFVAILQNSKWKLCWLQKWQKICFQLKQVWENQS